MWRVGGCLGRWLLVVAALPPLYSPLPRGLGTVSPGGALFNELFIAVDRRPGRKGLANETKYITSNWDLAVKAAPAPPARAIFCSPLWVVVLHLKPGVVGREGKSFSGRSNGCYWSWCYTTCATIVEVIVVAQHPCRPLIHPLPAWLAPKVIYHIYNGSLRLALPYPYPFNP